MIAWLTDPANWSGPDGIPVRLGEHVTISVLSLLIASAIALPVGLWIGHTGRASTLAINTANIGRAIPSLAAIGLLVPITQAIDPELGFKVYPTLIAMVILAVPPILVNAYAGVSGVDRELVEAARGMGLQERQILRGVEMPIALPIIAGGLRSASVQVIATATLGAIFGFGGLGRYLVDGAAQNDDGQLFGGVFLVAALALTAEGGFALVQRLLTSPGIRRARSSDGAASA
ncbi:MAG: ABC transporter permease [Candidatus Limnocylindrales bacterium]